MDRVDDKNLESTQNEKKLTFLLAQHESIISITNMVDVKSATTIAIAGLAITEIPVPAASSVYLLVLYGFSIFSLVLSIVLCLLSIMPRVITVRGNDKIPKNTFSWVDIGGSSLTDLNKVFLSQSISDLILSVLKTNNIISEILRKKCKINRFSILLCSLGIILGLFVFLSNNHGF